MKRLIKTHNIAIATSLLLFSAVGCSDDMNYPGQTVEEGLPATISVNVSLPEMTAVTRADMQEGLDYEVNSLWIGVYNASSGSLTGTTTLTGTNLGSHVESSKIEIDAKTGYSYIVAVANYEGRTCSTDIETGITYEDALAAADTFEKFKSISANFNEEGQINVSVPLNALLMSGHYITSDCDGSYTDPVKVEIPQSGTLTGSIHLRRLISQVKFNVDYNTSNISSFEVVNYQVYNVPNQSWLFERSDSPVNVGDNRTLGSLGSYQSSDIFNQLSPTGTIWSFDWWQFENKRTGLDWVEKYADREVEYKDASGLNTGYYASLVSGTSSDDPNNNATFVEMKVKMTMNVDENGSPLASGQQRVVDAIYTIHLGYCEGTGASRARDFNCRRNTKYTYNVTINNINDIYVEATNDFENSPGAEGIISDVTGKYVEIDAHYGVYNIQLPETSGAEFRYIIRCYDKNSNLVTIDSNDPSTIPSSESDSNWKYFKWIEIRATENGKIATYLPRTGTYSDGKTYTLEEFRSQSQIEEGWYTVFFNEYVYEDGNSSWSDYVNKPDRQVWLSVQENKSSDNESALYSTKYAFTQKSIQTFYGSGSITALGMEHENESYGLNLRNSFNDHYNSIGTNENNGRYNTYEYLNKVKANKGQSDLFWSTFVNVNSFQEVNAIENSTVGVTSVPAQTLPLPLLQSYYNTSGKTPDKSSYDPDLNGNRNYIEAINACMNRNRDLNGDGKIDVNELRWYVPTTNQYTQIILGTPSLSKPIMDYDSHTSIKANNGDNMNLFVYSSNGDALWTMEGFSTSQWGYRWDNPSQSWGNFTYPTYAKGAPWDLRCVRNLGTSQDIISSDNEVNHAYQMRSNSNIVELTHYDSKSIRREKITKMVPHDVSNQTYNSTYKAFEYKPNDEIMTLSSISGYNSSWSSWLSNSNPCSDFGADWRVPNQQELMILMTLGVVPDNGTQTLSATFGHYDDDGNSYGNTSQNGFDSFKIMSVRNANNVPAGTQLDYSGNLKLRCVRDVD